MHTLLTNLSHDVNRVINTPADLAFVECWHHHGIRAKLWPTKYLGKEAALEGFSPMGVICRFAFASGRDGKSWRSTRLALKRMVLPPSNLPGQLIKVAHIAS